MIKWYHFLIKHGMKTAVITAVVSVILFLLGIYIHGRTIAVDGLAQMADKSQASHFDIGLILSLILLVAAVLLLIGGIVWDVFRNFKTGKKTLLIFGALAMLFIVLVMISGHDDGGRFALWASKFHLTKWSSKVISGSIYLSIGLLIGAFVTLFYYEIKQLTHR
jgi:uncharacterized membrane protein